MKEYLVSGCLAGLPCRFDGASRPCKEVMRLVEEGRAQVVCPESLSGLPVPRPPAEQQPDGSVRDLDGKDVGAEFRLGAERAMRIALQSGCKKAILKARSPSCGVGKIHDGSFSGKLRDGNGIFAAKLLDAGFEVMDEEDYLNKLA